MILLLFLEGICDDAKATGAAETGYYVSATHQTIGRSSETPLSLYVREDVLIVVLVARRDPVLVSASSMHICHDLANYGVPPLALVSEFDGGTDGAVARATLGVLVAGRKRDVPCILESDVSYEDGAPSQVYTPWHTSVLVQVIVWNLLRGLHYLGVCS